MGELDASRGRDTKERDEEEDEDPMHSYEPQTMAIDSGMERSVEGSSRTRTGEERLRFS